MLLLYVHAVVGNIQAGVLHCETLEDAENATILRVATSPNEVGPWEAMSGNVYSKEALYSVLFVAYVSV